MALNLPDLTKDRKDIDWLWNRTLFLTAHGSHAYGTSLPTSDHDYKGFTVPPREYWLGYLKKFEQAEFKGDPDMTVYSIQKFFKLAADCNPSIIEVLFTDPADHVIVTPTGQHVLDHKDLFLSKKAKFTFSGYATSQLKKIETHRKWLLNPPKAAPTRADFGLPERTAIPADQLATAEAMISKQIAQWRLPLEGLDDAQRIGVQDAFSQSLAKLQIGEQGLEVISGRMLGFSDNFLELLDKERHYKAKMEEWRSYQNWLATRNAKRSELEARFGYDTKHGMHLMRLMRMGVEILEQGKVYVRRPDAEELLAIRGGAWSYEKLREEADRLEAKMGELYRTSTLPHTPDHRELDKLLIGVVETAL